MDRGCFFDSLGLSSPLPSAPGLWRHRTLGTVVGGGQRCPVTLWWSRDQSPSCESALFSTSQGFPRQLGILFLGGGDANTVLSTLGPGIHTRPREEKGFGICRLPRSLLLASPVSTIILMTEHLSRPGQGLLTTLQLQLMLAVHLQVLSW